MPPERDFEPAATFAATLTRADDRTAVVALEGELDLLTGPQLQAVLDQLEDERTGLVLDLSRLDFIDSTGVHLVLRTVQAWQAARRDVVLRGAGRDVLRAFELVGLTAHLPFED